jgi:putative DNA primase/helicase
VNTCADIPNKKINETGIFKMLVSGDPIYAEKKGKDGFTFTNRAKLVFSANEIPPSDDMTPAFIRRWSIIPFRRTFEGDEVDSDLIKKLTTKEELAGLLKLAFAGMKLLESEGGFGEESIEEIKAIYETNASRVRDFTTEMCIIDPNNGTYLTETKAIQQAYRDYVKSKGDMSPIDDNVLGAEMKRLGVVKRQKRNGTKRVYLYAGIKLKAESVIGVMG